MMHFSQHPLGTTGCRSELLVYSVRPDLAGEPRDVEEEVQPGGAPEGPGGGGEEGEERRDRAHTRLHLHTDRTGKTRILPSSLPPSINPSINPWINLSLILSLCCFLIGLFVIVSPYS